MAILVSRKNPAIEAFKEEVRHCAENLAQDNSLGERSQWKVYSISMQDDRCSIKLVHTDNAHSRPVNFAIPSLPRSLSHKDKFELRKYINEVLAEHGFQPNKPRRLESLDSDIIERVRQGNDPVAQDIFIKHHYGSWLQNAQTLLDSQPEKPIYEAEDVVNIALQKLFSAGHLPPDCNPAALVMRNSYGIVMDRGAAHSNARQSDGRAVEREMLRRTTDMEYPEALEQEHQAANYGKMREVLLAAREQMNERQVQLLDILMDDFDQRQQARGGSVEPMNSGEAGGVMTFMEIKDKLGVSLEYARQLNKQTNGIIQRTACRMGPDYAELADHMKFHIATKEKKPSNQR